MRIPATQTPCTSMFLCKSRGVLHMHSNDNTCNDNGYALVPGYHHNFLVVLPVFLGSGDIGGVSGRIPIAGEYGIIAMCPGIGRLPSAVPEQRCLVNPWG